MNVDIYYLCFPKDSVEIKCLGQLPSRRRVFPPDAHPETVYGVLIYEWVQTGLSTDFAFDNYVYGYGDLHALTAFHNTWFSVTIMCAIISAVVQMYFAWRIWILARSHLLVAVIIFLSLGQMSVGILKTVDPSAAQASQVTPVVGSWLAGAALVDVVIAVSMTILLLRAKTGLPDSDSLINRLVRLVLETGTLTATVAIADVVLFTSLPSTLLHECPALVLPKLYTNTLVASLNNRAFMARSNVIDTTPSRRLGSRGSFGGFGVESHGEFVARPMHVDVLQETFVSRDIVLQDRQKRGGLKRSVSAESVKMTADNVV
ncbi:hypothetical protein A0H81_14469 [Grifola frondosa]|uniref:DUF6534 domain-containing protein n=1 Tax=Grifola frondosa TaxID=5627 RepID=A0A1C7LLX5_GRIFR|nr:hypothetical protein A0H81_14469 [Grifola frondosa]